MLTRILVAIDRSAGSRQVFNQALSLAKATSANLILLHVLSAEELGSPMNFSYFVLPKDRCLHVTPSIMRRANEVAAREWGVFSQKGQELLRFYAKKALATGVQIEFSQITGVPSSTICDFARSCHADLVVIGRQGHSGFPEMLLGSVSNYVVHHAPCSVLLVQTSVAQESTATENLKATVYA